MSRLVLSRNLHQSVRIGPDFFVTYFDIDATGALLRCTGGVTVRLPHCEPREVMPGVAITFCGKNSKTQIRLAFEAPQEVVILRTELLNRRAVK